MRNDTFEWDERTKAIIDSLEHVTPIYWHEARAATAESKARDQIIDEVFLSVCSVEEREYWIQKLRLQL